MRAAIHSLIVFLIYFLSACNSGDVARQQSRSLDSLSGALSQAVTNLKNSDTTSLQRALARFNYYAEFIEKNVDDTLEKQEADQLRVFYRSGGNLKSYQSNRQLLLVQGNKVLSQINILSKDIREGALKGPQRDQYVKNESDAAARILTESGRQQELWHRSIQEFKNSVNPVEQIIRRRNHGELPTIIKDTLSF